MDALPIKTVRLLTVASLFTLLHFQYASCENGGGIETFVGSFIYSGLIESGDSVLFTATLHLLWNQLNPFMNSLVDIAIQSLQ